MKKIYSFNERLIEIIKYLSHLNPNDEYDQLVLLEFEKTMTKGVTND